MGEAEFAGDFGTALGSRAEDEFIAGGGVAVGAFGIELDFVGGGRRRHSWDGAMQGRWIAAQGLARTGVRVPGRAFHHQGPLDCGRNGRDPATDKVFLLLFVHKKKTFPDPMSAGPPRDISQSG